MKIIRAMKKRSQLQGEIKELKKRAGHCLNTLEGNDFPEVFPEIMAQVEAKVNELINLKGRIMAANIKGDKFKVILELGEMKSRMDFLRELNVQIGSVAEGYRENILKYKSQWTLKEKNDEITSCQAGINELVEQLDDFNATTDC